MSTNKTGELPAELERLRQRFERWRRTHRVRSRIPDSLWTAAASAAGAYGMHRVTKALRLGYYSLKQRVEPQASDPAKGSSAAAFIELPPLGDQGHGAAPRCECTLELEDGEGAKMRVHLRGVPAPDLVALCRSLRSAAS